MGQASDFPKSPWLEGSISDPARLDARFAGGVAGEGAAQGNSEKAWSGGRRPVQLSASAVVHLLPRRDLLNHLRLPKEAHFYVTIGLPISGSLRPTETIGAA